MCRYYKETPQELKRENIVNNVDLNYITHPATASKEIKKNIFQKIWEWLINLFRGEKEYKCPEKKVIDCFPKLFEPEKKECKGEYYDWIRKNCNISLII